uniref:Uncharacterized protein n=1 Tax=Oryza barthii TaxID=65489 RepID=A0A0D3GB75_9ORYZ
MEERIPEPQDPTADVAADVLPAEASSSDVTTTGVEEETDSDGEFEFEFPFVSRDSPAGTAAVADDLFADGRIKPSWPRTLRRWCSRANDGTRAPLGRLFLEESRGSFDRWSSSTYVVVVFRGGVRRGRPGRRAAGELLSLDSRRRPRLGLGLPTPAQEERLNGELVVGRSHSDGKEKFMFLPIPPPSSKENDVDHFKPKPKPTPASGRKTVQVAAAAEIDTRGKPSTEPAIAMRDRSPPGQQHHHDTNTLKRRPHEGCDAERRRRHPSKELDKVFTQSSLPREDGYLNSALRRVTTPEGEVTVGPKKLG